MIGLGAFDFLLGKKEDQEVYKGETLDKKPLFNIGNRKSRYGEKSRFLVLGTLGKKDKETFQNVKQAIEEMGYSDKVIFVRNNVEVVSFGVVNTPALVVDNKVVTYGHYLTVEDVKKLFKEYVIE